MESCTLESKQIAKIACFNKAKQLQCIVNPYQGHQWGSRWMHRRNVMSELLGQTHRGSSNRTDSPSYILFDRQNFMTVCHVDILYKGRVQIHFRFSLKNINQKMNSLTPVAITCVR